MCDDMMLDIQKYQDFLYKREDVKPYLQELDTIFQSIDLDSTQQEIDNKIDEVVFRFFGVKSLSELRSLDGKQLEDLELFEMYIYNEMEELF
jgi:hypothetical protein